MTAGPTGGRSQVMRVACHSTERQRAIASVLKAIRVLPLTVEMLVADEGSVEMETPAREFIRLTLREEYLVHDRKDCEAARRLYRERRAREAIFDPGLFGEPAWDILLDLLHSEASSKPISISSASIASTAPMTTALRWISVLTDSGLVRRAHNRFDERRRYLRLTDLGRSKLRTYFNMLPKIR